MLQNTDIYIWILKISLHETWKNYHIHTRCVFWVEWTLSKGRYTLSKPFVEYHTLQTLMAKRLFSSDSRESSSLSSATKYTRGESCHSTQIRDMRWGYKVCHFANVSCTHKSVVAYLFSKCQHFGKTGVGWWPCSHYVSNFSKCIWKYTKLLES
jgi:hypothetical protein